jgi:hypothetical protein
VEVKNHPKRRKIQPKPRLDLHRSARSAVIDWIGDADQAQDLKIREDSAGDDRVRWRGGEEDGGGRFADGDGNELELSALMLTVEPAQQAGPKSR